MTGAIRFFLTATSAVLILCLAVAALADGVPPPPPPEDISADIIKCDANSCQVSDRLIGSMAGLPGCLVDLSSKDGERQMRQVDNFRKTGTRLQPSGEVKVMYHNWLDQTRATNAKILRFLSGAVEKNDRLEVKSTMLPGVSCLPEDLDYARIAAAFAGKPQEEMNKYGIVLGVMVYEVDAAVYNTSSRKIDIDWPCYALAGGKSLLYKSGQESSKCFLMAVYAPLPFCLDLQALAKFQPDPGTRPTEPDKHGDPGTTPTDPGKRHDTGRTGTLAVSFPDLDPGATKSYDIAPESGATINKLLKAYVSAHKPTVKLSDAPRAVIASEVK